MILLSICIPTYNRAELLCKALESILPQVARRDQIEVVVCDNASTDGTKDVVDRLIQSYPLLRYHRNEKNLGFDGNIVVCIEQGRGRYISLFSDDDISLPGSYGRILKEIQTYEPAILYVNHFPFREGDPRLAEGLKMPAADKIFINGKEFFLFAGLGFISSLTLKRDYAEKYTQYVKLGPGQAHLDISARICMYEKGPYVFLGTLKVAARIPDNQRWDWLEGCGIAESDFYHGLVIDGILDRNIVRKRVSRSIRANIFGLVMLKRCKGDYRGLKAQEERLVKTYGTYKSFWVFIYPVLIIPRFILCPCYNLTRRLVRFYKNYRSA
ncbi:MAG: glycosyltransferase family 2 protein [Anaerolineaceae bacterium]|nr:glycosyltransferase family 2 protein [Anaerolineaceae bacterium]